MLFHHDLPAYPWGLGGLVLFWSLKNPTYPERVIRTRQGVGHSVEPIDVEATALKKGDCPALLLHPSVARHQDHMGLHIMQLVLRNMVAAGTHDGSVRDPN